MGRNSIAWYKWLHLVGSRSTTSLGYGLPNRIMEKFAIKVLIQYLEKLERYRQLPHRWRALFHSTQQVVQLFISACNPHVFIYILLFIFPFLLSSSLPENSSFFKTALLWRVEFQNACGFGCGAVHVVDVERKGGASFALVRRHKDFL